MVYHYHCLPSINLWPVCPFCPPDFFTVTDAAADSNYTLNFAWTQHYVKFAGFEFCNAKPAGHLGLPSYMWEERTGIVVSISKSEIIDIYTEVTLRARLPFATRLGKGIALVHIEENAESFSIVIPCVRTLNKNIINSFFITTPLPSLFYLFYSSSVFPRF